MSRLYDWLNDQVRNPKIFGSRLNDEFDGFDTRADRDLGINGDHEVSQEKFDNSITVNASAPGNGFYLSDMNRCFTKGSYSMTWQRQTAVVPPGFRYAGKFTITGAQASPLGADDCIHRFQKIEGIRTARLAQGGANAKSFVCCYAVMQPTFTSQTINVAATNAGEDRNYIFRNIVPQNTWTVVGGTVSGCPDGTWLTGGGQVGLIPILILGSGSNTFGTVNAWNTGSLINATSDITNMAATNGAILYEVGPFVFPGTQLPKIEDLAKIIRHRDETLALCERHYEMSFSIGTVPAQNVGLDTGEFTFPAVQAGATAQRGPTVYFRRRKSSGAPTLTTYNPSAANAEVRDRTAAADCSGVGTVATESGFRVGCTGAAGTAVSDVLSVHWTADSRL